jgi:CDP-diacylglycerol--glycerol-3-phosphate 3-phosphatidyltransferase
MKRRLNLPNRITVARLALAVVFIILLAQYSHRDPRAWMLDAAVAMFVIAAGTDFIDGYIARKRKQETPLGRVLDPLVDKVLVCGAFILFAGPGFVDAAGQNVTQVSAWMVVVIVGRELLVTGLRGFNESVGKPLGASIHGKLKMWMQSIAAPLLLFIVAHEEAWFTPQSATLLKGVLVWATVLITALSAIHYLKKSRFILEESAPA